MPSGSDLEEAANESGVCLHVVTVDVVSPSLPDHRHHLVADQRSPGGRQAAEAEPGRAGRLIRQWSCSTMLFRYLRYRSRATRQNSPIRFSSVATRGYPRSLSTVIMRGLTGVASPAPCGKSAWRLPCPVDKYGYSRISCAKSRLYPYFP